MTKEEKLAFLRSRMDKSIAIQHILHYRNTSDPTAIKSVWLDHEIIDLIREQNASPITGIRVYMAKYKEGVDPTLEEPHKVNQQTVILSPTIAGVAGNMDMPDTYFNYGSPCPPEKCDEEMPEV